MLTDEAVLREQAAQAVQANMAAKGYLPVETPTLEVMDVLQAGGRLPGTPFKLFDARGDLLAMRPDVTLQIARMCATRLAGQPGPFRFRYMQRVFREAEGQTRAEPRETTQMGVELIGQAGAAADAEVVGLLAESLKLAGVADFKIALASVSVLRAARKLRRCAAVAPGGARCVPHVELRHARRADLRRGRAGRSTGVRPGHLQARSHPRRARRHRRGARIGGPAGLRDGP